MKSERKVSEGGRRTTEREGCSSPVERAKRVSLRSPKAMTGVEVLPPQRNTGFAEVGIG